MHRFRLILATPFLAIAAVFATIGGLIAGDGFYIDEPRPHH